VSYGIPIFLKLRQDPNEFPLTSFALGPVSRPLGCVSAAWLFGSSVLLFLPLDSPITAANMNWTVLAAALVVVMGGANWHFNSKHTFRGPKRFDGKMPLLPAI
jgi:hypothetical protein